MSRMIFVPQDRQICASVALASMSIFASCRTPSRLTLIMASKSSLTMRGLSTPERSMSEGINIRSLRLGPLLLIWCVFLWRASAAVAPSDISKGRPLPSSFRYQPFMRQPEMLMSPPGNSNLCSNSMISISALATNSSDTRVASGSIQSVVLAGPAEFIVLLRNFSTTVSEKGPCQVCIHVGMKMVLGPSEMPWSLFSTQSRFNDSVAGFGLTLQ
mmetsp:Transcript_86819/g.274042  ORF Transcript_86819/g.274042 Transcript_86819/m.274042 type:complete len:215 (-) Transcript_86819:309-953(-)